MIRCEQLTKIYQTSRNEVHSLHNVTLEVGRGEFVCVRGPSGCGKTTLLLTLGGMLHPTSGQVVIDGQDLYALNGRARARFRSAKIGFVFQMFHLVPYLTVTENVLLAGASGANGTTRERAVATLERLGLAHRLRHRPAELSAGERQRTAIARALLNEPMVILADEPTGNLDPDNAAEVLRRLKEFQSAGGTVVLVTHGPLGGEQADRIVELREGRVIPQGSRVS